MSQAKPRVINSMPDIINQMQHITGVLSAWYLQTIKIQSCYPVNDSLPFQQKLLNQFVLQVIIRSYKMVQIPTEETEHMYHIRRRIPGRRMKVAEMLTRRNVDVYCDQVQNKEQDVTSFLVRRQKWHGKCRMRFQWMSYR